MPKRSAGWALVCVVLAGGALAAALWSPWQPERVPAGEGPAPTPALDLLLPRIEQVLAGMESHGLRTDREAPTAILHALLAHGRDLRLDRPAGRAPVEAVGYLLDGAEPGGLRLLGEEDGVPRLPDPARSPELQAHRDQILMVLASAGVPAGRTLTADTGRAFTVRDLLDASRRGFVEWQELGWTLAALAAYGRFDEVWTTTDGEAYRVEDVVRLAISRDPRMESCGGTHHLYGVACALGRHVAGGGGVDGVWGRARDYLESFVARARSSQRHNGELSAAFFRGSAPASSRRERVFVNGHTLEWLTAALPGDALRAPWVRRAVALLCDDLSNGSLEELDPSGLYHAVHALRRYRRAVSGAPDPLLAVSRL